MILLAEPWQYRFQGGARPCRDPGSGHGLRRGNAGPAGPRARRRRYRRGALRGRRAPRPDALCDGFDACDFDLYVGTSAGALIAALLANRVTPERLRDALEHDRRTLPRLTASRFLSLPWPSYLATLPRLAAALPGMGRDLVLHWREALVLEPYGRDLRLFDTSLMTYAMRHEVIRRGYRTTVKTVLSDFDRHAALLARHGIRVVSRRELERRARRWSSAAAVHARPAHHGRRFLARFA